MAFMTMFWAMDAGALSLDTNWEEVNPTNTMMDVAGVVNDDRLTIAQYVDGSTLVFSNLTSVGQNTFTNKTDLKYVKLGKTVTNIGNSAFSGCSELTSVTIPDNVMGIGSDAFSGCRSLVSVTIPDSCSFLDHELFMYCYSLKKVTIGGNSKISLSWLMFRMCTNLTTIICNTKINSINENAF